MRQNFFFNIDVLGSCNLKCPSCPVGNFKEVNNPTGFMEPQFLDQIMRKATAECHVTGVGLFNWTEPLLHPCLPDLIKIIQSYHVPCMISSNLNVLKNIDYLLATNPRSFRISVSGFNQAVYELTHRGGNIERVKKNMVALAESKQRIASTTNIHVLYHRYLGNLDDEIMMKQFVENLEFDFQPVWAFMMPLEKILAYVNNDLTEVVLTQEDLELIERLALPLQESIEIAQLYKSSPCGLRDNQMTLDFQGNVQLCCSVYDSNKYTLASFLSTPLSDLQKLKYSSITCTKCMDKGIHVYNVYGAPEFDQIAMDNLTLYYSRHLLREFV